MLTEGEEWGLENDAQIICQSHCTRSAILIAEAMYPERRLGTTAGEAQILARARQKPQDSSTHWSTRKLAALVGGSYPHEN